MEPWLRRLAHMTVDDLERYAVRRFGLVAQSIERLRPKLPRWIRTLHAYGFRAMPRYPYDGWSPRAVALFDNVMAMMLKQDVKNDPEGAHRLRNLIGLPGRPFKI